MRQTVDTFHQSFLVFCLTANMLSLTETRRRDTRREVVLTLKDFIGLAVILQFHFV